ncbi:MAG TPA: YCF48-related protein [Pyrinomonadaceae bacterium]
MLTCRKSYLLIFVILFCIQIIPAQSSWSANRVEAAGDLVAVFFTSSDKGFVAGDKGYLGATTNGGRSWTKQAINTKEDVTEIYFRNDDNGYLVAGKDLFSTRDGGRSWQKTVIFNENAFKGSTPEFLSIRFADKKLGVVIGSLLKGNGKDARVVDSLVMRTNNGGENWSRVIVPTKAELYHLDFAGDSHGWIVGASGLILSTSDGGLNWQIQKSGTNKDLYNVDFRDENNGFAVGEDGIILRTENGGATWETIKTSFPNTFLRVDFADEKNGWIVGFGGTILRSSDKGRTWIRQESNTKDNFYGLYMTRKYGWAVGSKGLIAEYQK